MPKATENDMLEGELSVRDLLLKLWFRRGLIVLLPMVFCLIGVSAIFYQSVNARPNIIHYVNLIGVDRGMYPNGSAFSPQDLRAPEVLDAIAGRTGLASSKKTLFDAISVSYSSPNTAGILKKYDDKLNQRGVNSAQIDLINAELQEELKSATMRTLRLSVDYLDLGLNAVQGAELVAILPQIWSEIFISKFRVLDDLKLNEAIMPGTIDLKSSRGAINAKNTINDMIASLEIIENDNRLQLLVGASGVRPSDLRSQLSRLNNVYLDSVLSEIIATGDSVAAGYLNEITLEIQIYEEKIAGINETISSILPILSRSVKQGDEMVQSSPNRLQLSASTFDDIVTLVNDAALSEYITNLFERRAVMIAERADLKAQVSKLERGTTLGEDLITQVQIQINEHTNEYIEILRRARDMNRRNVGELHEALGAPFSTGTTIPPRAPWMIGFTVSLGLLIALVAALLLPVHRENVG